MKTYIVFLSRLSIFSLAMSHHGHEKKKQSANNSSTIMQTDSATLSEHDHDNHDRTLSSEDREGKRASLSEFTSLHPLVVHFPVVLLVIAIGFQGIALFWDKTGIHISTWLLLLGICRSLGGCLLGSPHTHDLTAQAACYWNSMKRMRILLSGLPDWHF